LAASVGFKGRPNPLIVFVSIVMKPFENVPSNNNVFEVSTNENLEDPANLPLSLNCTDISGPLGSVFVAST
jgi:hypothetical protein